MYKKILSVCLSLLLLFGFASMLCSCSITIETGGKTSTAEQSTAQAASPQTTEKEAEITTLETEPFIPEAGSIEALEAEIIAYAEGVSADLLADVEALAAEIATYDAYVASTDKVDALYGKIIDAFYQATIRLCEYSVSYAELVLSSDLSTDEMYDAVEGIYDCIYDDAADILYDEIYDDVLDEMYDVFYDGALDDIPDHVDYDVWYDVHSDAYDAWYDARSDCYDIWYDLRSDIYEFRIDIRSELYSDDVAGAYDECNDFKEDIQRMKS